MDNLNQQAPESTSKQQQPISSSQTLFHPKTFHILLAITIVIILGLTIFLLSTISQSSPTPVLPIINQPSPTTQSFTFQKILEENCVHDNAVSGKISTEKLPLIINTEIVNAAELSCSSTGELNTWYAHKDSDFFIFDDSSKELGHGGISYFEPYGEGTTDQNGLRYYVYLQFGEGPLPIGETSVNVRAIKELKISSDEITYVSTTEQVIEGDDPRLVNLLNQYSILSESYPGQKEISDYEMAEEAISAQFFGNFDNLKSPEKEKIEKMKQLLSAFSEK
ncbi:MAG: hypothetical protein A2687_01480 [Candidatus Levybacteria bacterium RIFCSPHIGHO2_01_FULL_38_26]|nr:MAG: hypothetical protein A2687_01480 [Candidatus Levybacteria bacterium RIFCSPHIGHO2_01_FULL_38_26]